MHWPLIGIIDMSFTYLRGHRYEAACFMQIIRSRFLFILIDSIGAGNAFMSGSDVGGNVICYHASWRRSGVARRRRRRHIF